MTKTPLFLVIATLALGAALYLLASNPPAPSTSDVACSMILEEDIISVPLTCKEDIGYDTIATMTVAADGSLRVTRDDGTLIFANAEAEDGMGGDYMAYDGTVMTGSIRFEDVTFDGYKDIAILYSAGAYNWTYQYYGYDPEMGTYSSRAFLELTNPDFDLEAQTLTEFAKGRGLGDMYVHNTYHFQGGGYTLVRRETQDFATDDMFGNYIRTVEELRDGQMTETERENLSYKDVWGEDAPSAN